MAVPFRRTSKTKKRMRRTHLKKTISSMTTCSNCGATIKNHRMCTKCGFYKGKEVVKKVETKVETKYAPKKAEKATKKIAKTGVTKTTKETKNSKK